MISRLAAPVYSREDRLALAPAEESQAAAGRGPIQGARVWWVLPTRDAWQTRRGQQLLSSADRGALLRELTISAVRVCEACFERLHRGVARPFRSQPPADEAGEHGNCSRSHHARSPARHSVRASPKYVGFELDRCLKVTRSQTKSRSECGGNSRGSDWPPKADPALVTLRVPISCVNRPGESGDFLV